MRHMKLVPLAALAGVAGGVFAARRAFRRDMADIAARLETGSRLVDTSFGTVEYGREGRGAPALVIHGAGGGYDQGLFVGRELLGAGHDVIAPSRFGYLGTDLPEARGADMQADAHAALLDALKVSGAVVLGISAGAPSAIELALRHPERVSALILVVPRAFAPGIEVSAERTAANRPIFTMALKGQDFAWWAAARWGRRRLLRFLGVPPCVYDAADPPERERLDQIARSVLPLSRRARGIAADGGEAVGPWPLERIATPTLVVSTKDDPFNTLPAARWTAEHVPGAELMVLDSGGHLLSGSGGEVRARITGFLRQHSAAPRRKAA